MLPFSQSLRKEDTLCWNKLQVCWNKLLPTSKKKKKKRSIVENNIFIFSNQMHHLEKYYLIMMTATVGLGITVKQAPCQDPYMPYSNLPAVL